MQRALVPDATLLGGWAAIRASGIVSAMVALPVGPALAGALARTFPLPHADVFITGVIWLALTAWLLDAARVQLKATGYNASQGRDVVAGSAAAGRGGAAAAVVARPARAVPVSV